MNFKKTLITAAVGLALSHGAFADGTTYVYVPDANAVVKTVTVASATDTSILGLTDFSSIAAALDNTSANISALATSFNDVALDGSISVTGATIGFSAIENVTATATATSSNIENATATASAINGNKLSTTVIGAMATVDLENSVSDKLATDFAAQAIDAAGLATNLTGLNVDNGTTPAVDDLTLNLGAVEMVSASVNTGALSGNIEIAASNLTPTWFLNEATVASVNLTNLEAATTVIGAMNTTTAVNEVMRDLNLKTAVQVVTTPTP